MSCSMIFIVRGNANGRPDTLLEWRVVAIASVPIRKSRANIYVHDFQKRRDVQGSDVGRRDEPTGRLRAVETFTFRLQSVVQCAVMEAYGRVACLSKPH